MYAFLCISMNINCPLFLKKKFTQLFITFCHDNCYVLHDLFLKISQNTCYLQIYEYINIYAQIHTYTHIHYAPSYA